MVVVGKRGDKLLLDRDPRTKQVRMRMVIAPQVDEAEPPTNVGPPLPPRKTLKQELMERRRDKHVDSALALLDEYTSARLGQEVAMNSSDLRAKVEGYIDKTSWPYEEIVQHPAALLARLYSWRDPYASTYLDGEQSS